MNNASLAKSPRLQRLHRLLSDGAEHSTLDCVLKAKVCAVNAAIAELRANGAQIDCRCVSEDTGKVWYYRMVTPAPEDQQ